MSRALYVVTGEIGGWDDIATWNVAATQSLSRAEAIRDKLERQAQKIYEEVRDSEEDGWDHGMSMSADKQFPYHRVSHWEGVSYYIEAVEVDDGSI